MGQTALPSFIDIIVILSLGLLHGFLNWCVSQYFNQKYSSEQDVKQKQ